MRKIAIVGFAPSSREEVKNLPDDVEIWGMNDAHSFLENASRWFQIHEQDMIDGTGDNAAKLRLTMGSGDHWKWLTETEIEVYMIETHPDIPASVRYPIEDVWPWKDIPPYLTSSVAYMLALAVAGDVNEIHLYGVDLSMCIEYHEQKACVEFWIGIAMERGIKVHWPDSSGLLFAPLYGRPSSEVETLRKMAQARLRGHKDEYMRAWGQLVRTIAQFEESVTWVNRLQVKDLAVKAKMNQHVLILGERVKAASATMQATLGLLQETYHWASTMGITDLIDVRVPDLELPRDLEIEETKTELVKP